MRPCLALVLMVSVLAAPALGPGPAAAAPAPALAMHGEPKYPADFDHFDYVDPAAPVGGTVRLSQPGSFDTLNPFAVRGRRAAGWGHPLETLMMRGWDEPFTLYGLIAATIDTDATRSWVEFDLRPEARWHDGRPITAADVVFSWRVLRDQGRPNHRTYYRKVVAAEAAGNRVRFRFAPDGEGRYDREMPLIMGLMPVLAEHFWRDRDLTAPSLEPSLGSGPYRVDTVDPGRSVTYRRVADYWGAGLPVNRGRNNFELIRYEYFRADLTALEAFTAGEIDVRREPDPVRWLTAYASPALTAGRIRLERLPHGRPEAMRGLIFNLRRPLFGDRRVRQAFTLAFDFEWMNRTLFRGAYVRTESYYPNSELAASGPPPPAELTVLEPWRADLPPELFREPFVLPKTDGTGPAGLRPNLRQAATLLAEAGYGVSAGALVDPAGAPVAFDILLVDPADERFTLEYARALARFGILARVRTVDSAQYKERLARFDFDMTVNWWISTLSPGNEQLVYFGSAAADQAGGWNYPGIRSAAVDGIAGSLSSAHDRTELVTRVRALDRVLLWGYYAVPLFHVGADLIAAWDHVRRPAVVPLYGVSFETWWEARP